MPEMGDNEGHGKDMGYLLAGRRCRAAQRNGKSDGKGSDSKGGKDGDSSQTDNDGHHSSDGM